MGGKKLSHQDLEEMKRRTEIANQYYMVAQAIDLQKRIWLSNKIKEMGIDMTKNYDIDPKNGEIKEIKEQPKNEPTGAEKSN